jgi:hypothetical protein
VIEEELVADAVQLVGRDAGRHVPAHLDQGLSRYPPGDPHALDRLGVLHVGLTDSGGPPADVFGAVNVCWDAALRGNPAGLERCRHDLKV